jgi:hypothetical protein
LLFGWAIKESHVSEPGARISSVVFLMIVAVTSLVNLIARPRFQTYNVLDVLQTGGIGVCFGVAATVLLGLSRKPSSVSA